MPRLPAGHSQQEVFLDRTDEQLLQEPGQPRVGLLRARALIVGRRDRRLTAPAEAGEGDRAPREQNECENRSGE